MISFLARNVLKIVVVLICSLLAVLACFDPIPLDGLIPIIGAVLTLTIPAIRNKGNS